MTKILVVHFIVTLALNFNILAAQISESVQDFVASKECENDIYQTLMKFNAGYVNDAILHLNEIKNGTCQDAKEICSYYIAKINFDLGRKSKAKDELDKLFNSLNAVPAGMRSVAVFMLIECIDANNSKSLEDLELRLNNINYTLKDDIKLYLEAKIEESLNNYTKASKLYEQASKTTEDTQILNRASVRALITAILSKKAENGSYINRVECILARQGEYSVKELYQLGFALEEVNMNKISERIWGYLENERCVLVSNKNNGIALTFRNDIAISVPFALPKYVVDSGIVMAVDIERFKTMTPEEMYRELKGYKNKQISVLGYYVGKHFQENRTDLGQILKINYPKQFQVYFLKGFLQNSDIGSYHTYPFEYMNVKLRNVKDENTLKLLKNKIHEEFGYFEVKRLLKSYFKNQFFQNR
jgi:tetratricopeptide (TPR) repeat protein